MSKPKIKRNLEIVNLIDNKKWTYPEIMYEYNFKAKSTVSSIYNRFKNPEYVKAISSS